MALDNLFKKKEKKKPAVTFGNATGASSAGQPGGQSQDRQDTQEIAGILRQVRFKDTADVTGRISQEDMDVLRVSISNLMRQLDSAQIIRLKAHDINLVLKEMADKLPAAISGGNYMTALWITKGLSYGVTQARKDISELQMDKADEIVQKRLARLNLYLDIINIAVKNDELSSSIRLQEKKLEKYHKDFDKCADDLVRISEERPDLVRELDELGGESNELSASARAINTARRKVINLRRNLDDLERTKASNEAAIAANETSIRNLETMLIQSDAKVDEQTMEDLKKQQEAYMKNVLEMEAQIREMESISADFNNMMKSVYSSPEMVNDVIRTAMEYEAMLDRQAAEEAGRQEGQRMAAEKEKQRQEAGKALNTN